YLLDGESLAIAKVVDAAAAIQRPERQNVRLREIKQMNIIADTGTVARWIVRSKNEDFFAFAHCHLENNRNQMKLRIVILSSNRGCSSSIEIAQAGEAHSANAIEPMQDAFKNEF